VKRQHEQIIDNVWNFSRQTVYVVFRLPNSSSLEVSSKPSSPSAVPRSTQRAVTLPASSNRLSVPENRNSSNRSPVTAGKQVRPRLGLVNGSSCCKGPFMDLPFIGLTYRGFQKKYLRLAVRVDPDSVGLLAVRCVTCVDY
jgi:hypothetical protein